jgi:hypothetical protein
MKQKIILYLKKNWKIISILIIGLIAINFFFNKKSIDESELAPHIELTNTLLYNSQIHSFTGDFKGFVKLNNEEDQPKNARQYFTIDPTSKKDQNSNQVLILDEIIALNTLPAQSIGKTMLFQKSETANEVVLEDENGLQLFYNKNSGEISLEDARLLTNDSDYRTFTINLLK